MHGTPCTIVVAHPDDEILFFNSVVGEAAGVVFCFGPCADRAVAAGRERLKADHPLRSARFLDIPESDVLDGLSFGARPILREGVAVRRNAPRYRRAFDLLRDRLRSEIGRGQTVYTHNPWGEYGHPEHVQVFHAVRSLIGELDLTVFVNGYVSDKTWEFMARRVGLLGPEPVLGRPCGARGARFREAYVRSGCWTWTGDYSWPATEVFYRVAADGDGGDEPPGSPCAVAASPPLTLLTTPFRRGRLRQLVSDLLPREFKAAVRGAVAGMRSPR